jgi:hypothetical protein
LTGFDFRSERLVAGDEVATMLGSLERQRRIVSWKGGGLDSAGLSTTVGVATVTLGGLLQHPTMVEDEARMGRIAGR